MNEKIGTTGGGAPIGEPAAAATAGSLAEALSIPGLAKRGHLYKLEPAPRRREYFALVAAVLLADLCIYPEIGFASSALLFAGVSLLLILGTPARVRSPRVLLMLTLTGLLGARLVWSGGVAAFLCAAALTGGLAIVLAGGMPFVFEGFWFLWGSLFMGCRALAGYFRWNRVGSTRIERSLSIPAAVIAGFAALFLLANPNFQTFLDRLLDSAFDWFKLISLTPGRVILWLAAAWTFGGLMRPVAGALRDALDPEKAIERKSLAAGQHSIDYQVARNTLASVVALFAVYLIYEVVYLIVRKIPEGFYYSGYAHAGAFWLTVALAFSTFTLGWVLRGDLLGHPRIGMLKRLTWIWTAENIVLALCVFHRLALYIGYNGLSRARMVGIYGVAAVAIGFLLAVRKALADKSLIWLIRRDLWALFFVILVWALTPVDWIVTRYNVASILGGNLAPSVQIGYHDIDAEGLPALLPLLNIPQADIRDGVKALLAVRQLELESAAKSDWRSRQLADEYALRRLKPFEGEWAAYRDQAAREAQQSKFHEFSHAWYD